MQCNGGMVRAMAVMPLLAAQLFVTSTYAGTRGCDGTAKCGGGGTSGNNAVIYNSINNALQTIVRRPSDSEATPETPEPQPLNRAKIEQSELGIANTATDIATCNLIQYNFKAKGICIDRVYAQIKEKNKEIDNSFDNLPVSHPSGANNRISPSNGTSIKTTPPTATSLEDIKRQYKSHKCKDAKTASTAVCRELANAYAMKARPKPNKSNFVEIKPSEGLSPGFKSVGGGKTKTIDAETGMSPDDCAKQVGSVVLHPVGGTPEFCMIPNRKFCVGTKIVLTYHNSCKRAVQGEVFFSGATGWLIVPPGADGVTECTQKNEKTGNPAVNCAFQRFDARF